MNIKTKILLIIGLPFLLVLCFKYWQEIGRVFRSSSYTGFSIVGWNGEDVCPCKLHIATKSWTGGLPLPIPFANGSISDETIRTYDVDRSGYLEIGFKDDYMRLDKITTGNFPLEGYTSKRQIPGHEPDKRVHQNELSFQYGFHLDASGEILKPSMIYHIRLKPLRNRSLHEHEISREPLYVSLRRFIRGIAKDEDYGEKRGNHVINILPNRDNLQVKESPPVNIAMSYYNQSSGITKENRHPKRKTYDWWVELKIDGGGFIDTDDIETHIAPKDGYAETLRYEMNAEDESWTKVFPVSATSSPSGVKNNIYFKTADGNYGTFWLVVKSKINGSIIVRFEDVVYNHGGGRNLDPREFGMVKLNDSVWRY